MSYICVNNIPPPFFPEVIYIIKLGWSIFYTKGLSHSSFMPISNKKVFFIYLFNFHYSIFFSPKEFHPGAPIRLKQLLPPRWPSHSMPLRWPPQSIPSEMTITAHSPQVTILPNAPQMTTTSNAEASRKTDFPAAKITADQIR